VEDEARVTQPSKPAEGKGDAATPAARSVRVAQLHLLDERAKLGLNRPRGRGRSRRCGARSFAKEPGARKI